jgi:hypothetical protein
MTTLNYVFFNISLFSLLNSKDYYYFIETFAINVPLGIFV